MKPVLCFIAANRTWVVSLNDNNNYDLDWSMESSWNYGGGRALGTELINTYSITSDPSSSIMTLFLGDSVDFYYKFDFNPNLIDPLPVKFTDLRQSRPTIGCSNSPSCQSTNGHVLMCPKCGLNKQLIPCTGCGSFNHARKDCLWKNISDNPLANSSESALPTHRCKACSQELQQSDLAVNPATGNIWGCFRCGSKSIVSI